MKETIVVQVTLAQGIPEIFEKPGVPILFFSPEEKFLTQFFDELALVSESSTKSIFRLQLESRRHDSCFTYELAGRKCVVSLTRGSITQLDLAHAVESVCFFEPRAKNFTILLPSRVDLEEVESLLRADPNFEKLSFLLVQDKKLVFS